jgi:pimeloyl-ACP methyl ester carboxylesterase
MRRILAAVIVLAAALTLSSVAGSGGPSLARGRLIDIGRVSLFIQCLGKGSPTIVLENGANSAHYTLAAITKATGRFARVCIYDRPGLGDSSGFDDSNGQLEVLTSRDVALNLHALLRKAGVRPPYVLVGASIGGMFVRSYLVEYPKEVAGMVMLDSTTAIDPSFELIEAGIVRYDLDASFEHAMRARLRERPLLIMVRSDPPQAPIERQVDLQIARTGTNSLFMTALRSEHAITDFQPRLVVEGIRQTELAARKGKRLRCVERFHRLGGSCERV